MNKLSFLITSLTFLMTLSIKAESGIEQLWSFHGHWDVEYFAKTKDGTLKSLGRDISKYESSLGGKLIEESSTVLVPGASFLMRNFYSFDKSKQRYRLAAVDQTSGLMDIYEGEFKDGKLTMTNLNSKTFYITPEGQTMAFRLNWTFVDNNHFELLVEMSADHGTTWQYMSYAKAKRLNFQN